MRLATLEINTPQRVRCTTILNELHMAPIMGHLVRHSQQILDGLDAKVRGFMIGGCEYNILASVSGTGALNTRCALLEVYPTSSAIRSYIMIESTGSSRRP